MLVTFKASDVTTWDVLCPFGGTAQKIEFFLCRPRNSADWSVIQQFLRKAPMYANAHGRREVLTKGQNVREVVIDYVSLRPIYTLRFSE